MKVAEFYSGIGGWSSALQLMKIDHTVVGAFDINTVSNEVYLANYFIKPSPKSLESISEKQLSLLDAELWVMSPPCQPYTRNNETENRDMNDPRSKSFLRLIELLGKLQNPPKYLALENVVGFEKSHCCSLFLDALKNLGYSFLQFHLTPTQFNVPNDRPRYYCIAAKGGFEGISVDSVTSLPSIRTSLPNSEESTMEQVVSVGAFLDTEMTVEEEESLRVPQSLTGKSSGWCFDIRTPHSRTTACFTKSYASYIKGTGSVLLVLPPDAIQEFGADAVAIHTGTSSDSATSCVGEKRTFESVENNITAEGADADGTAASCTARVARNMPGERLFEEDWWTQLVRRHCPESMSELNRARIHLRYFSPRELTRLFGFSESFRFPAQVARKKQYEMIGNSLSVVVAGQLLRFLLPTSSCNIVNESGI